MEMEGEEALQRWVLFHVEVEETGGRRFWSVALIHMEIARVCVCVRVGRGWVGVSSWTIGVYFT